MDGDDSRRHGIEFGALDDRLAEIDYPISNEELIDAYGDHELDLVDGSVTLRSVLSRNVDDTFESADEVRRTVENFVGSDAVGREDYTDRTTGTGGEHEESL